MLSSWHLLLFRGVATLLSQHWAARVWLLVIPRKSTTQRCPHRSKKQSNAVTSGKLPSMHFCKVWTDRIKWLAPQSCPRRMQEWKSSYWCCSPCPPKCQVWPLKQWSFFQQEALDKVPEFFRAPFKHEGPLTWPGSSCCASLRENEIRINKL